MSDPVPAPISPAGCLLRLFSMLFGFGVLLLTAILMVLRGFPFLEWVWWGTTGGMIVARYLEIRYYEGRTATGRPAGMRDWGIYAGALAAGAAAVRGAIALAV